jgi:hypothetical protein
MSINLRIFTTEYCRSENGLEFHGGGKDYRTKTPWYANRSFDVISVVIFILFFLVAGTLYLSAQITVSGLLDSSVSLQAGAGDAPVSSCGFEEYANLRMQAKLRDKAVVYSAVNLIAAAGNYAANAKEMAGLGTDSPLNPTLYVYGENCIAAVELERLYFRLSGESVNFDGGLMRLPFGYGQVWRPSDFLNPGNPLKPDARPRAILGAAFSWYPTEETKLLTFYSAPRDPFSQKDNGSFLGLSFDKHWNKASIQILYCFETPKAYSNHGIHRAGLSIKADMEVGLLMDILYTYDYDAGAEPDGLSFSAGADYSFFDGKLIVLAEYLYNGEKSSTAFNAEKNLFGFSNNNYLYTNFTLRFNDYTNISAAVVFGFDDISFTPVITLNHDLFQGAALIISAQVPMDCGLFSGDGNHGELGPIPPGRNGGRYFECAAKIRLRF